MDVSARELRDTEISDSFRGYNKEEVNDLLDRAAVTIESLEARIRQLAVAGAQPSDPSVAIGKQPDADSDSAARTLSLAQRVADEAVALARAEASEIIAGANDQSRVLLAKAEAEGHRIVEAERRSLESELTSLTERRSSLEKEINDLARFEAAYRNKLVESLREELAAAEELASSSTHVGVSPQDTSETPSGSKSEPLSPVVALPLDAVQQDPMIDLAVEPGVEATEQHDDFSALQAPPDDSDDFFASLREATNEDAPLSAGEEQLFEVQESDSGIRDLFRRRR